MFYCHYYSINDTEGQNFPEFVNYVVEKRKMNFDNLCSRKNSFEDIYTEAANVIKYRGISFDDILPEDLFCQKSMRLLHIPIGIGDEDAVINLALGKGTSHHCLIGGGTGGGKSTLLHTIIMSGMLNYSPEQLQLYLMDFKGGTEFKIYESQRLPHIHLIALDAMQEFGESILENLVQEMEKRSHIFKEAGGYTKIQDYVGETGLPMLRILIIMDDLQLISKTYAKEPCVTQVFEGSRTVALLDYLSAMHIGFTDELPVRVHMGDKIKVAPPFCLSLGRKKKHNMLICGTNQQMTNNVLHNYLISALLNQNT